ncbi:hypothetical protein [Sandaracinobacteroides saxicola]|uniref:Envelope stress response membrane protein PspB n=1 Tax=Sandaracinobacteroides saxicola TaxID=2759707 RepID=A0A7G5ILY4_9SPHN|nr:hypothetical protein [Sandaracinobacteroides saxicola]QMW24376.1 hypothetical protein H3309_07975 [Sandaracinobacteroides saxicola]
MGELALLIPIMALAIPFYAIYMGNKRRSELMRYEHEAAGYGSMNSELASKVARLEARVEVLERIATDKSVHLASEIENLRRSA